MFRKLAILAALAVVAILAVSEPAMAGVGGCRNPGVGGCGPGGGFLTTNAPSVSKVVLVLDSLRGAIPQEMIALVKSLYEGRQNRGGLQQPGDTTTQGVGGCRNAGVGGCWL